jgi:hypothetical protein
MACLFILTSGNPQMYARVEISSGYLRKISVPFLHSVLLLEVEEKFEFVIAF